MKLLYLKSETDTEFINGVSNPFTEGEDDSRIMVLLLMMQSIIILACEQARLNALFSNYNRPASMGGGEIIKI